MATDRHYFIEQNEQGNMPFAPRGQNERALC
jgi:hypothetical protein